MTGATHSRPDVSVAMTICDGLPFLREQVVSMAEQELPWSQLVIADDGSIDGGAQVVTNRFGDRAQIISLAGGQGTNRAMAAALAEIDNPLVAMCDHDDVWYTNKLASLVRCFDDSRVMLAVSDARLINSAGEPMPSSLWQRRRLTTRRSRQLTQDPLFTLLRSSLLTGATMMFRRSLLEYVMPLPTEILPGHPAAEAHPMFIDRWISLVAAGVGAIALIPTPLMDYRVHEGQQTGPGSGRRFRLEAGEDVRLTRLVPQKDMTPALQAESQQLRRLSERLDVVRATTIEDYRRTLEARAALPVSRRSRTTPLARQAVTELRRGQGDGWRWASDLLRR